MTERDKIIEVIDEWANKAVKANKFDSASVYNPHNAAELADALIAAGIGDTTNLIVENEVLQRDVDNLMRTLEEGSEEFQEAEHRAQVAERALLTACVNLIKDEKDNVNMELLARVVYTNYLRKAKKELTEGKKDANRI